MVTKRIIQSVRDQIVKAFNPEKVFLFGSHAYGKPNGDSDLDIFIVMRTRKPHPERIRMVRRAIKEVGLGIDVIVRTPKELERALKGRNWFIQEIVEKGKVLYER